MGYVTYSIDQTNFEDTIQIYFDYYIDAYIDPESDEYFGDTFWTASFTQVDGPGAGYVSDYSSEYGSGYLDIYSLWQPGIVHYHVEFHAENRFSAVSIDDSFDLLTAYYSIAPVTITGTANNDLIYGGAGADTLIGDLGDDRFLGGAGRDTLIGGLGNDTYVNPAGDVIVEDVDGGTDTVETNATFSLATRPNVENITLMGTANINAGGNAANNRLAGNSGNNILNGGAGIDTMIGGAGNDTYYVDRGGDLTIEYAGGGIDLVSSSISRTLSANIENLNLSGTANIDGNGNELDNTINGNTGNNVMRGYAGNDVIRGNAGADTIAGGLGRDSINPGDDADRDIIRYASVAESTGVNRDLITGMDLANEDRFDFPAIPTLIRAQVNAGTLSTASFDTDLATAIGAGQLGAGQAVLFDPSAGNLNIAGRVYLIVDANGIAGYQAGQDYVIELSNHTGTLTLDDFM